MQDETRPFPLADHIRVYRDGRIESCLRRGSGGKGDVWRLLKIDRSGKRGRYPTVRIRLPGQRKARPIGVHRVVAYAWLGDPPFPGALVRHLDDKPRNFHADNLAWGTNRQNFEDAVRNGRVDGGVWREVAKLTEAQREQVRLASVIGLPPKFIAKSYGTTLRAVLALASGKPIYRDKRTRMPIGPLPQPLSLPRGRRLHDWVHIRAC